jgi:hypothetical protein
LLGHELKRKIEKWEMSGQGDGGRMTFDFEDEDALGCGEDDITSMAALSLRS